jgi:hypothetical protein
MLVLSELSLCVKPLQGDCVREPVLPSMVPALVPEAELKDAPKKAPSTRPRKEPLARATATLYWTPGEYAVTGAPVATCLSAIEKPPPAPATEPCGGAFEHKS